MPEEKESGSQENPQIAAAEVRLMYQDRLDNIRDQKSRHWSVTYYILLLYGALVAVLRIVQDDGAAPIFVSAIATVLVVLIALASILFLVRTQSALIGYRNRLVDVRRHFTKTGREAYGHEGASYRSPAYDVWIPISMGIISLIGMVVVIFLAWGLRPKPPTPPPPSPPRQRGPIRGRDGEGRVLQRRLTT